MLQREFKALPYLVPLPDNPAGDHDDVFEYLFGEVPVLSSGASRNISGRKERRNKNPSVVQNAFRSERVDGCGDISPRADPGGASLARAIAQAVWRLRRAKPRAPSLHQRCGLHHPPRPELVRVVRGPVASEAGQCCSYVVFLKKRELLHIGYTIRQK